MKTAIFLIVLVLIGFLYRIYGLLDNHSFWTDEAHLAIFARAILGRGEPILSTGYSTGAYQWLAYWLTAFFAAVFGLNEFAIRFPSIIFGTLSIVAVYLLGRELFGQKVGLIAAVLTTFLSIEILWSRQARPYQAIQFLFILGVWFLYRLTQKKQFNWWCLIGFLLTAVLGMLMHGLGLVILISGFGLLLLFRNWQIKNFSWILPILILIALSTYLFWPKVNLLLSKLGSVNNIFYYRIFLWHNYLPLVVLALIGIVFLVFENYKKLVFLILPLLIQTIFISFFLNQPFTRYFYPVFLFFILLVSVGMDKISSFQIIRNKFGQVLWASLVLVVFIFLMGQKLTILPKYVYSLNEDMQEIPEVDYKKVYKFIGLRLRESPGTVLASNWNDHAIWYLGEGSLNYRLRKNPSGREKDPIAGAFYVGSVEELKDIMKKEKSGLVLLESWETELPTGSEEFIKSNFKKEFQIDRLYADQPRYWPVTVYSWGFEN